MGFLAFSPFLDMQIAKPASWKKFGSVNMTFLAIERSVLTSIFQSHPLEKTRAFSQLNQ